jgi:hypothetical protein
MKVLTPQQCRIELVQLSPRLPHQISRDAFAGMTLDVDIVTALGTAGEGFLGACVGSVRRRRSALAHVVFGLDLDPAPRIDAPLDRAELGGELVVIGIDVDLALFEPLPRFP